MIHREAKLCGWWHLVGKLSVNLEAGYRNKEWTRQIQIEGYRSGDAIVILKTIS